jgi:hypothetical protein
VYLHAQILDVTSGDSIIMSQARNAKIGISKLSVEHIAEKHLLQKSWELNITYFQ